MKLKFWQYPALASGAIIAVVLALASISYNATLGTSDLAFSFLNISNSNLFGFLALAFDIGMTVSVFGFWHWRKTNHIAAFFLPCAFCHCQYFFGAFCARLYCHQYHKITCT